MSSKNFIIKNGLTIGSTEVINSSGIVQGSSVNEAIDDRVNALLTAGSGISLSYDDANNSLTITGNVGDITGVNAGDGLTGTATSGDATLNIGAGTGITVNADDIEVNMSAFDTDDLSEGSTNQYFTNERVDDRVNALLTAGSNVSLSYDDAAGTLTISATEDNLSNNDTDDLSEGSTNLYHTTARVRSAISATGDLSYDSSTGIFSFTNDAGDIESVTAGAGLAGGGTSGAVSLAVNVDDSSIEIDSDSLQVKASGITNAMLAGSIANEKLSNSSITVNSNAVSLGGSVTLDTSDFAESGNLFHTTERVQDVVGAQIVSNGSHTGISFAYDDATDGAIDATVSLSPFDTDDLSEGSTNTYFTNARADARVNLQTGSNLDLSSKDSDDLSEGSSNLYFTNERVDDRVNALITAGTGITSTYDDANGTLTIATSITQYADSDARGAISVTDSGGDGSLAYNSSTGVITYTGPSASETRAHISGGTGVSISSGEISIGQAVATNSNVTFNNATIDGNLTVNGTTVTNSATNTTIEDALIELGSGNSGANSNDLGLILERGSTGDNGFMGWDESADRFVVATTTATGSSTGGLTLSEANFRANQITTSYASNSGGVARNIYQSTSAPTSGDGQVGDLWILYS